ncbi:hypothetical protein [Paenibacillus sp. MMS20-IR301]|uniref:hypothetical protein n=1 Tax=Paenibacillus sp. MMS20-IR301 TaxID=2895946 RepID=UPI0028ED04EB|nr:hypothetical protein [Paenibacillus sp. MMS20-IR301]WNS43609.1 hypothetical protein LOS79_32555 [Paenibacillus sp. MMS20-IR301]
MVDTAYYYFALPASSETLLCRLERLYKAEQYQAAARIDRGGRGVEDEGSYYIDPGHKSIPQTGRLLIFIIDLNNTVISIAFLLDV